MATTTYNSLGQSSSQRSVAMLLALAAAVVLSPLYVKRKSDTRYDTKWNSSFYLPMVLGGLIIAIRTTSSSSSQPLQRGVQVPSFASLDASSVFKFGSSSVGLAGVFIMLVLVLSWQNSVQGFFWR
ncbi:hypothetical protein AQUCO_00900208v1 [Aquilegia coerulea]|uniref:Uncharacterized protein n=1 Tax=Aquilegia coerulea TaxID=218851 RepID=A0A2G5ED14_AQUCA|nr:hypothetical protein AQUCO_00900208v1 [Aquilegia coerulea]